MTNETTNNNRWTGAEAAEMRMRWAEEDAHEYWLAREEGRVPPYEE